MQDREGHRGLAPIDGVGQLVAGHVARLAEIRLELRRGDACALTVGGSQRAEKALHPPQVLAYVRAQQLRGLRLELDRGAAEVLVQPGLSIPRTADGDVDHLAGDRDGLDQRGGHGTGASGQDQHGRGQRVLDHLDQAGHIGGEEPARVAHDHDTPVDQEGRRQAGVDDRTDIDVVGGATDLLDDQGVVTLAHHLGQEGADLLGHQRRVVALDEVGRGAHRAAPTAATTSRTRQVPLTSCTRKMRQPQARPSAAAPREAGPRSVSSRPSVTPRKVLLDTESRRG